MTGSDTRVKPRRSTVRFRTVAVVALLLPPVACAGCSGGQSDARKPNLNEACGGPVLRDTGEMMAAIPDLSVNPWGYSNTIAVGGYDKVALVVRVASGCAHGMDVTIGNTAIVRIIAADKATDGRPVEISMAGLRPGSTTLTTTRGNRTTGRMKIVVTPS